MPYRVPAYKPLRVVQIEGYSPVPCGGTHLRALDELGAVRVRKIKLKGSSTQVGYTCEPFRN
jgi:Ser-tRNA(Ala) deacylase AlaX